MFSNTIIGRVVYMEPAVHEGREFLAIKLAVSDISGNEIRIKFNNSNGLFTAYKNGTLVIGHQLILTQFDVRLNSIRTHYLKDEMLHQLKYPEIALTKVRAVMGSAPRQKAEVPHAYTDNQQVEELVPYAGEPTLETVPF
jgi:hypothetical protein